jgi:antitoxin (DNA-binding transcriptional repressor) of toxin-antitoxin stability system
MPKQQKIGASEARNNFSDIISKVQYQQQIYLIERYGEVVAKIVPASFQRSVEEAREVEGSEVVVEAEAEKEVVEEVAVKAEKKDENLAEADREELRNLRDVVRVSAEAPKSSDETIVHNHFARLRGEGETDRVEKEAGEDASSEQGGTRPAARSALKKLEELIQAQKSRQEARSQQENQQAGEQPDQQSDQQDKPEIIRKKIEL